MTPRTRRALLPAAALTLFAFAHVAPVFASGRVLAANDFGSSAIPAFATLRGHFPVFGAPSWTDAVFGGAPEEVFAAMPRYPLNAAASILDPHAALLVFVALHLAIAAVTAWQFARRVGGATDVAALAGALVYAFGGALWLRGQHPDYLAIAAWMPLALLATWEISGGPSGTRRRAFTGVLGATGGLMLLVGGGAPILMLATLAAVPIVLDGLMARQAAGVTRRRAIGDAAPWLVGAGAIALAIGAPGLVPFLATIREGARGELSLVHSGGFSLTPPSLMRVFVPELLLGGGAWQWPQYVERWLYVGVITLPLAALGAREPRGRWLLLLTTAAIVLGLGLWGPLHYVFYYLVPGYSHFCAPGRWAIVAALPAGALAARGLDQVIDGRAPARSTRIAAVAVLAAAAAATLAIVLARDGSPVHAARGGLAFFAVQAVLAAAWLDLATRGARPLEERAAGARRRVVAVTALILLGADLAGTALRMPITSPASALEPPAAFAAAARAAAENGGRLAHDDAAGPRPLNNGVRWGYRNARGYSQIVPERLSRLLDLGRPSHGGRFTAEIDRLDAGLFRLLGVGAWVGDAKNAPPPGFHAIARDGDLGAFAADAPPFAFAVVGAQRVVAEGDAERDAALAANPAAVAVLVEDAGLSADGLPGGANGTLTRQAPGEISGRFTTDRAALLVVAEAWHPRWAATVDGTPVHVYRADAIWQAIKLPAGDHAVAFHCRSAVPWWSWLSSLAGLAAVGILLRKR